MEWNSIAVAAAAPAAAAAERERFGIENGSQGNIGAGQTKGDVGSSGTWG